MKRCLRKDPRTRLRDLGDASIAIDEALADPSGGMGAIAGSASVPRGRSSAWVVAGAALASTLLGFALGRMPPGRASASREGEPGLLSAARVTHDPSIAEWLTWSPDGRSLAYCRSDGGASLWLLTIGDTP